ncbi:MULTISPECIES: GntR family transcriptional regulator [unclassified Pseudoalteromonas]|uniref:GntR family transcriptional regulator n=1 Tax=unclassified Pseudoalteromonas TaxID=194690 RepID=UPI000C06829A|nr:MULTISPECIES: GntR family transcriptional regulator [unclassified Pseudoalteromonas]MDP2633806.1 GntR family transcriptional regulator [Pseudoalteromonas sp. 1_MG-2023]PHN88966.1 GntR family transcriptional regulator [Pseudoalteromonas sp. 3D05]
MLEFINVNPNSGDPIYKQLHEQIVRLIVGGQLATGDELPSVRKIADHFAVNPMTVSRAIGQLVDQGWLERRRGQATRVAQNIAQQSDQQEALLYKAIDQLIQQTKQLDVPQTTLVELIKKRWELEQ